MSELARPTARMDLRPPAAREADAATERALGVRLPPDYVEFMLAHNGGEGPVGEHG